MQAEGFTITGVGEHGVARPERIMGLLRCLCNCRRLFDCSMLLLAFLLAFSGGCLLALPYVYFLHWTLLGEVAGRSCIDTL